MAAVSGARADRGAVTVELALAMPVLIAVVWAALWAVGLAGTQMACADAARAGARAAARGESSEAVAALVRSAGPPGAGVTTSVQGELVTVRVVAAARRGLFGWRGPEVVGVAVSQRESPEPEREAELEVER